MLAHTQHPPPPQLPQHGRCVPIGRPDIVRVLCTVYCPMRILCKPTSNATRPMAGSPKFWRRASHRGRERRTEQNQNSQTDLTFPWPPLPPVTFNLARASSSGLLPAFAPTLPDTRLPSVGLGRNGLDADVLCAEPPKVEPTNSPPSFSQPDKSLLFPLSQGDARATCRSFPFSSARPGGMGRQGPVFHPPSLPYPQGDEKET